jgi:hypothetical protein
MLAGASYGSDRKYPDQSNVPAPKLDAARTVNEQDCTKPIQNWSANLKCR